MASSPEDTSVMVNRSLKQHQPQNTCQRGREEALVNQVPSHQLHHLSAQFRTKSLIGQQHQNQPAIIELDGLELDSSSCTSDTHSQPPQWANSSAASPHLQLNQQVFHHLLNTDYGSKTPAAAQYATNGSGGNNCPENWALNKMTKDEDIRIRGNKRDPLVHRITEKQRRDKMNSCLSDLSQLIPVHFLNRKSGGRIEKIDIVIMAIEYISELKKMHDGAFARGFFAGLTEAIRYAKEQEGRSGQGQGDQEQEGKPSAGLSRHMNSIISKQLSSASDCQLVAVNCSDKVKTNSSSAVMGRQLSSASDTLTGHCRADIEVVDYDVDDEVTAILPPKRFCADSPPSMVRTSSIGSSSGSSQEAGGGKAGSGSQPPTKARSGSCPQSPGHGYKKQMKERFMSSSSCSTQAPDKGVSIYVDSAFDLSNDSATAGAAADKLPLLTAPSPPPRVPSTCSQSPPPPPCSPLLKIFGDSQAAAFVLHPSKKYYMPTFFDSSLSNTIAQEAAADPKGSLGHVIHPVNICVAFISPDSDPLNPSDRHSLSPCFL
ncbi:Hairy and enhancer of split-related protein HELT [Halotydeus destructor]|nr:Hairy and enhancer of split-related protein HELT [Halotydeus destructor]